MLLCFSAHSVVKLFAFMINFLREIIKDIVIKLTSFQSKTSIPIKKRLITFGITILFIVLIFSFDSFIEYWLGASTEKIIE